MTIEMENSQIRRQIDVAYSELRSQFINITKPRLTANVINSLKMKYANVINSHRTYDYIKTVEELLRILEKRGILRYDNIDVLKYISSTYVRDEVLERILTDYENGERPSLPPHNRYLMQTASEVRYEGQPGGSGNGAERDNGSRTRGLPVRMELYTTQPAFRMTLLGSVDFGSGNPSGAKNDSEVIRKVLMEVSEKLGRNWRDVARYLRVTEYEIDEINSQSNLSLKEKALMALLKFQSKCDSSQWKSKLKRALLDARRRDLMELVDELLP